MNKIGDFSNRAGVHQPVSSQSQQHSVFKLKHPALAQILGALEQSCNPATRFLMNTRLAKMSMPIRQKISATLQNFVNEIRQQIELENNRYVPVRPHDLHSYPQGRRQDFPQVHPHRGTPGNFQPRHEIPLEEVLRNPAYWFTGNQAPPHSAQHPSAQQASSNPPTAAPSPSHSSEPRNVSAQKSEHPAPAGATGAQLSRMSMRESPDASCVQQLIDRGMSESGLRTLKEDIRAIREQGSSSQRQDDFDAKYTHLFDSSKDGGIRDNETSYTKLFLHLKRHIHNTR